MLMQLPVEIIIPIAEELDDSSRESLSYTCREFNNLLLPYNELHLSSPRFHNVDSTDRLVDYSDCPKCALHETLKYIVSMPLLARRIVSANVSLRHRHEQCKRLGGIVYLLSRLPNLKKLMTNQKIFRCLRFLTEGSFKSLEVLYVEHASFTVYSLAVGEDTKRKDVWTSCFPALSWICFRKAVVPLANVNRDTFSYDGLDLRDDEERGAIYVNCMKVNDSYEPYRSKEDYESHIHDLFERFRRDTTTLSWERSGLRFKSFKLDDRYSSDEEDPDWCHWMPPEADHYGAPPAANYHRGVWCCQASTSIERLPSSSALVRASIQEINRLTKADKADDTDDYKVCDSDSDVSWAAAGRGWLS